jgi:hypothetical protein
MYTYEYFYFFLGQFDRSSERYLKVSQTSNINTLTESMRRSLNKISWDRGMESFNNFKNSIGKQENLNSSTRIFVGKMKADPG